MSTFVLGEPSRAARYLIIGCALAFVSLVLGIYASLGQYFMPSNWYAYTIVAPLLAALLLLVGNTPRLMVSIMILTLHTSIDFSLYSRVTGYGSAVYLIINAFDVAAIVLILLMSVRKLTKRDGMLPPIYLATTLPFLALIGITGLTAAFAGDQTLALVEAVGLLRCFVLYVAILCFVKTESDLRFVLDLLVLLLLVSALMYISQATLGYSFDLVGRTANSKMLAYGVSRLRGVNASGGVFACLCTFVFARLIGERRYLWRIIETLALMCGSIALIYTLSRGSWLALGAGLAAVTLLGATKKALGLGTLAVVVCIACVVLYAFGDIAMERITSDDKGAAMSRVPLMKQALLMIAHNPVLGVGAGNYSSEMKQYIPEGLGRFWEWTVHNDYLLYWAECGTIGFLIFLWFLGAFMRRGFKILRIPDAQCASLGLALLGFMAACALHMFVESRAMDREVGQIMSMLLAVASVAPGVWGRAGWPRPPQSLVPSAATRECGAIS